MTSEPDTAPDETHVSTMELFFDLVFVFTITQVALIVEHHPSVSAAAQALVELVVIYWMYGGFVWLTNHMRTTVGRHRAVLLAGMAAFFVVSLAVPRAFEADGVAFAVAYIVLNAVHLGSFLAFTSGATVRAMFRIGASNIAAAGLILVAAFCHGWVVWALWLSAIVVQWGVPLVLKQHRNFTISVDHFAERHGLMILIVLGESLISIALAAQELPVDSTLVLGTLGGLLALAALWWVYFGDDSDAAATAMAALPAERRGFVALFGYGVSHVLMLCGVVFLAAGARISLPELTEPTTLAAASFIAAGAAIYLLGDGLFRHALRFGSAALRAGVGLALVATVPIGAGLGAAQQLVTVAFVLVVMIGVESRLSHRRFAR